MKRCEAKRSLRMAFPGRTVCLTIEDWSFSRPDNEHYDKVGYKVSILPGLSGNSDDKCTQFDAPTLAEVLAKVRQYQAAPPPTDDELDQHFAEHPCEEIVVTHPSQMSAAALEAGAVEEIISVTR